MYLNQPAQIRELILNLSAAKILWLDTEIADWNTPNPRLSLIQVLADPTDINGDKAYILDVLDQPEIVKDFVNYIMVNPNIEKVFHNASFDLRYLGGKEQANNVTCTYQIARKLTNKKLSNPLQVSNHKLKTLALELCNFANVDTEEQSSDWGKRPLTQKQLNYAKMDTVYLAHVHRRLLEISDKNSWSREQMVPRLRTQKAESPCFSVTQVRVAIECPRLFYLSHHFGGKTLFIPPSDSPGIGKVFHQLCEKCTDTLQQDSRFQALFSPTASQLDLGQISSKIQALLYELVVFPQIDDLEIASLLQLWQGLTSLFPHWTQLLVTNRRYCQPEEVIRKTFIAQEKDLSYNFTLPDGSQQQVNGKFDSLIFDCERDRYCVVDYKTYQPVDPSANVAQVALYSYMLQTEKGVAIDAAVYSVLPEFQEHYYSWEELEDTVHQLIPHKLQQMRQWLSWKPAQLEKGGDGETIKNHCTPAIGKGDLEPPPPTRQLQLCNICPQQQTCQTFFEDGKTDQEQVKPASRKIPETKQKPVKPPSRKTVDADQIGKKLVSTLEDFKISVDYLNATVAPAFVRIKLKPHRGVKVRDIQNRSQDLQVHLGLDNPPLITPEAGYVSVDLPRKDEDREVARFDDYIEVHQSSSNPPRIGLGVNLDGKLVEADLSDPNTCHFLVGGTTGSGKSEFLRSLLLSLLYHHSPQQLKIALVDPKRVTFPEFEEMPWLLSPIVKDSDRAIELMAELVDEMEQRYRKFEQAKCAHLDAYNQQLTQKQTNKQNLPLPRIVCIFDEYADFMAEKEIRKDLELSIKRLGAKARAAGIHLIIATQRPEAKVVTPIIRSNLPGRIALRTASEADSKIIFGGSNTEAAYLLGKGDLLYQKGGKLERLQSLFADRIILA
ncbi:MULTISPECIES: DNA translocase FtsK [Moorena]|uniref:DNA segregation ATPase FtsK/SpoIIIE family protein n=1 Tax=Moorena producens 3L TaxID=489825 RepID=F4XU99_9CYAN|nr:MULTISPECIES: DNA translocase FtsK [Moorena]EGJ31724.1 DNA segregation ATPase FtsK/SpoIIIE family protein [Moorena producens 3L]NEP31393.1 cell division protein FtsK [Moorena sp. SIO3B2]NEP66499.1 cell division protein FtsK [Moorena sp. SIO3A5]OLT63750.1 cell division protein FtsK [Moorena producens 3L]